MENQIEQMQASIASLRENAAKYRRFVEAHRAADQSAMAERLMEVVTQTEVKVAELEAALDAFRKHQPSHTRPLRQDGARWKLADDVLSRG